MVRTSIGRAWYVRDRSSVLSLGSLDFVLLSVGRSHWRGFDQKSDVTLFVLKKSLWLLSREMVVSQVVEK